MTFKTGRALCDAAWDGDVPLIRTLTEDAELLVESDLNTALMHASHRGHHRAAELLLACTRADPNARNAEALWRAARYGRARVVRLLAPVSDTSGWEQWQWDELAPSMQKRLRRGHPTRGNPFGEDCLRADEIRHTSATGISASPTAAAATPIRVRGSSPRAYRGAEVCQGGLF